MRRRLLLFCSCAASALLRRSTARRARAHARPSKWRQFRRCTQRALCALVQRRRRIQRTLADSRSDQPLLILRSIVEFNGSVGLGGAHFALLTTFAFQEERPVHKPRAHKPFLAASPSWAARCHLAASRCAEPLAAFALLLFTWPFGCSILVTRSCPIRSTGPLRTGTTRW